MFWQAQVCSKQGARCVCRHIGRLESAVSSVFVVTTDIARAKVHAWVRRLGLFLVIKACGKINILCDTTVIDYRNNCNRLPKHKYEYHGCQNYRKMCRHLRGDLCVVLYVIKMHMKTV